MKVQTTIRSTRRTLSSASGNPSYYVTTDDGTWRTKANADCAHGITNSANLAPNMVELTIEQNRITQITPL